MLDIIRKKAASWGVKIIFGIIIVVFVFFFGYNRMSQKARGGSKGNVVARVDGAVIGRPEYQIAYENNYQMYKNIFKSGEDAELPPALVKNIRTSTLNQLVQEKIINKLGVKLGIVPTETELADAIRNSSAAKGEDGKFDPYLYKQRFLPYFSQKYNLDYESLVAGDLLRQRVMDLFTSGMASPKLARTSFDMERAQWSFEVTEFNNEADAKAGKSGKANKVGPVSLADRQQLFPIDAPIEAWKSIFSLSASKPATAEPVKLGEKWYKVRLTKFEGAKDADWEKERDNYIKTVTSRGNQELLQEWVFALVKKAKVKTFIEE